MDLLEELNLMELPAIFALLFQLIGARHNRWGASPTLFQPRLSGLLEKSCFNRFRQHHFCFVFIKLAAPLRSCPEVTHAPHKCWIFWHRRAASSCQRTLCIEYEDRS